jgi:hypothetical protein
VSLLLQRIEAKSDRGDMHGGLIDAGPDKQAISGHGSQYEKAGIEAGRKHLTELKCVSAKIRRAPCVDIRERRPGEASCTPPIV